MIGSHSEYYVLPNGRVQLMLRTQADRRNLEIATDEQVGRFYRNPSVIVGEPKRCGGCQERKRIVRWLGVDWYGVPFPKRLRWRWPIYAARFAGCGCIKPIKDYWERRRGEA